MRQTLKDNRGMKIGSIDRHLNGRITVYDKIGSKIGEIRPQGKELIAYDKRGIKIAKWKETDDCTYDKNNRKIGKGDLLLDLYFA